MTGEFPQFNFDSFGEDVRAEFARLDELKEAMAYATGLLHEAKRLDVAYQDSGNDNRHRWVAFGYRKPKFNAFTG